MKCVRCGEELDAGAYYCGNCGQPVGQGTQASQAGPISPNALTPPAQPAPNQVQPSGGGRAIASMVSGVVGLVGWLIPIVGLVLGASALVLGTQSTKSAHRRLATAGIILSVPVLGLSIFGLIYNLQQIESRRGSANTEVSAPIAASASVAQLQNNCDLDCMVIGINEKIWSIEHAF